MSFESSIFEVKGAWVWIFGWGIGRRMNLEEFLDFFLVVTVGMSLCGLYYGNYIFAGLFGALALFQLLFHSN